MIDRKCLDTFGTMTQLGVTLGLSDLHVVLGVSDPSHDKVTKATAHLFPKMPYNNRLEMVGNGCFSLGPTDVYGTQVPTYTELQGWYKPA